jgi:iron complex transport system ATP-binding protein
MIEVRELAYRVGKKELLSSVNLNVEPGEMLSVIGANGAGKSTFLKLLCRELSPSAGEIFLNNKNISEYKTIELARMRSVMVQQNTISMSFTVSELVLMGRYPHFESTPSVKDQAIVQEVMEETGISDLAGREYNTLSGGEQQRVQLSRVLAQIWDVPQGFLFMDEPTNGLDLLYQQQILNIARKMADKGFCVVCILHDINFASRYADKLLILKHGKPIAYGTPPQVINYANIYNAFNIRVHLMKHDGFNVPLVVPGVF